MQIQEIWAWFASLFEFQTRCLTRFYASSLVCRYLRTTVASIIMIDLSSCWKCLFKSTCGVEEKDMALKPVEV